MGYNDRDVYADSFYEGEFSLYGGDIGEAVRNFNDYLAHGVDDDLVAKAEGGLLKVGDIYLERGISAASAEKFDEALTNYQKAVKYNPKNVQARKRLAVAYDYIGEHVTALVHSEKAAVQEYVKMMAESDLDSNLAVMVPPPLETVLATS